MKVVWKVYMKVVWKYEIQPNAKQGGMFVISLDDVPRHSRPLCVMNQNGKVYVWFEVYPEQTKETFKLFSVGTGFGEVKEDTTYLGSVIQDQYVWHIYY